MIDAGCAPGCNPLSATACNATHRCCWVVDMAMPRGGDSVCLPGGAVAVGVACMRDVNGGDNCVKGATCFMGTCRQICDLAATSATCGTGMTCKPATGMFVPCTGTTPYAGLCQP